MPPNPKPEPLLGPPEPRPAFHHGTLVLVTLNAPREKFWGVVLDVSPAGLALRGIDLNSLDDFARQVRAGDEVAPAAVFFPMHRVERMEIDLRSGEIPSLRERFEAKSGRDLEAVLRLGAPLEPEITVGCTLAQAQRRLMLATLAAVGNDLARAAELLDVSEPELRSWLDR